MPFEYTVKHDELSSHFCQFQRNYRERNYAEMFVDIDKYITNHENAFVWKGTAYISDIQKVLQRFLGEERTKRALKIFNLKYNIDKISPQPMPDL
jgi:hypothetical protein